MAICAYSHGEKSMTTKLLEIRDRATFIPALAISIEASDGPLARRAGFESQCIELIHLTSQQCEYDPYSWGGGRTMANAHEYIRTHWDEISEGDVIDVEFILGESGAQKVSEA